ncbi:MAG: hypothetical protein AAF791_08535 [Bacteroidota bacterium]
MPTSSQRAPGVVRVYAHNPGPMTQQRKANGQFKKGGGKSRSSKKRRRNPSISRDAKKLARQAAGVGVGAVVASNVNTALRKALTKEDNTLSTGAQVGAAAVPGLVGLGLMMIDNEDVQNGAVGMASASVIGLTNIGFGYAKQKMAGKGVGSRYRAPRGVASRRNPAQIGQGSRSGVGCPARTPAVQLA